MAPGSGQVITGGMPPGPVLPPRESGLMDYLRVIARHKLMILGIVLVALVGGLAFGILQTPMYQATLTVQVQANPPVYVPSLEDIESPANAETFYRTQLGVIRSRAVAERVIDRLSSEERRRLVQTMGPLDWITALFGDTGGADGEPANAREPSRRALRATIQNNLEVFRGKDSELVRISYAAPTAELSARVANLIGDAYLATEESQRLEVSQKVHGWLSGQLEKLRTDLESSEAAVQQYKQEHGLLDSRNLQDLTGEQLSGISRELLDARAERMRAEVLHEQIQEAGDVDALVAVLNDPVIQQLKIEQAQLQAELDRLGTHYGAKAPKVRSVQAELDSTTARLESEIDRAVASIRERYQEAKRTEERLAAEQQDINEGVRDRSEEGLELARLEREAETNRQLYQAFRNRMKEISLAGTMGATGIRILDRALPPGAPFKPSFPRIIGIAGLLSLFGAVGLAFLVENLRRTFHTPQAVEQQFRLRGLGVVPRVAPKRPGMLARLAVLDPGSPFTEAVGGIRTRLQMADGEGGPQLVVVTSALPGEGKSTLSSNLASSYSQLNRTLLIDADLRRGSLSSGWKSAGLTDFVLGRTDLAACVGQDNLSPNLFLMGKGQMPVNPLDFFATRELADALAELRGHFDRIIVDSAPVLGASDVEMMGHLTDGAVLAVRAGKTPTDAVTEVLRRLHAAHVQVIGVTLTQADIKEMGLYGGYSYGEDSQAY